MRSMPQQLESDVTPCLKITEYRLYYLHERILTLYYHKLWLVE